MHGSSASRPPLPLGHLPEIPVNPWMPHLSAEDRKLPIVFCLRPGSASLARTPAAPVRPAHGHHTPRRDKGSDGHTGLCSHTPNGDGSHPGPGSGHEDQRTPIPPPGLEAGAGESSEPLSPSSPHPPRSLLSCGQVAFHVCFHASTLSLSQISFGHP